MENLTSNPIQNAFKRANLRPGQRITIVKENDFGCLSRVKATYDGCKETTYAQYDDVVKIMFKPYRKRRLYQYYLYDEFVILDDWINIPDEDWMYGSILAGSKSRAIAEKYESKVLVQYIKSE